MISSKACHAGIAVLVMVMLAGCEAVKLGMMNAAGPVAESDRQLYLILAVVLIFVAGPVLILTPLIAWHYRLSNQRSTFKPKWDFSWSLEGFIWIPPTAIVIGLAFLLWTSTHRLDPYRPIASTESTVEIEVVALDWKWLFIYPEEGVAVVNQLAIPVGHPAHLRLTSGTVMQSLLVPQLAGQIYAMAGMTTQLNLAADHPGTYLGENTQFNGNGFQSQHFEVTALPPAAYVRWIAMIRAAGHPLDDAAMKRLRKPSVLPAPESFSTVPAGLFQGIVEQFREPPP